MKILHISDLHIGKRLNDFLLNEPIKDSLDQIIDIIKEEKIKVLLISGDVYDKTIPSVEAILIFDEFINKLIELNIITLIIPGNHDSRERLSYLKEVLKEKNVFVASNSLEKVRIEDIDFYLMPYMNLYELRDLMKKEYNNKDEAYQDIFNFEFENKKNILLMHEYISYPNLEESDSERPLLLGGSEFIDYQVLEKFDYVALGHIHKYQKVTDKIRYSGSISKMSFSEEFNKNSCVMIDDNFNISRIILKENIKLVTIKGLLKDLLSNEMYTKYNFQKDLFKAVILDEEEVIGAAYKLKSIYTNLLTIEYKRTFESKKINQSPNKNIKDLFKDFYDYIEQKEITDDDLDLLSEIFLKTEEIK